MPKETVIEITVPENSKFGDYSTNVAFSLAKIKNKSPLVLAEEIRKKILSTKPAILKKIEVASPGFINFFLSDKAYETVLKEILKSQKNYGRGGKRKEKISLDYLDANPTGPVHLGHARGGLYGDVLSNVLEFAGYKVSREFYVNNAKSSGQIKSLGATALGKGKEYEHDQLLSLLKKPSVKSALKKIKLESEAGAYIAKLIQKENENFLEKKAKIHFNLFFSEESIYQKKLIEKLLTELHEKNLVYKKDGALWFIAKSYGDSEDRVFVRSDGTPTYVLPDLVYHLDRLRSRKYEKVIDIFGADHHGYGPRLKGALSALGVNRERVEVLIAQTVRLTKNGKEFKMSKREGVFVTLEELIKQVGLDVARFFFITVSLDTHFDFDFMLAKKHSLKNPVYYVQYAIVRAENILKKAKNNPAIAGPASDFKSLTTKEDKQLILELGRFPEVIEDTARDYRLHRLTKYAGELARAFHNFYQKERVIGEAKEKAAARLALVTATIIVLKNLFGVLGISTPKKM